jgi:hypothetical protein
VIKSQGIPVSKDILHRYIDHLEDAFMIFISHSFESPKTRERKIKGLFTYGCTSKKIKGGLLNLNFLLCNFAIALQNYI